MQKFVLSNNKNKKEKIEHDILETLKVAKDVFIVTGYSSIEYILYFLSKCKKTNIRSVRILIGNEFATSSENYSVNDDIGEIIKTYWRQKGFKLGAVSSVSSFIVESDGIDENGDTDFVYLHNDGHFNVDFRVIRNCGLVLHAKTFFLDNIAYNGSGNFSKNGLRYQLELMTRHINGDDYYEGLRDECDEYWLLGSPYTQEFKGLIDSIMAVHSDYRETMGLIYHEFFEGEWFNDVSEGRVKEYYKDLWPWQKKTASEALYTLENNGSVIIAEPTGSGKTKAGAFICRVLRDKLLLDKGFDNEVDICLVCPTKVYDEWRSELDNVNLKNITIIPASKIQESNNGKSASVVNDAHILIVDEAHEFRNMLTKRGENLFKENNAIYTILLSATPINRELSDFYGMICQIGADSMDKSDQKFMKRVLDKAQHSSDLDKDVVDKLKQTIKEVTVRKTKSEINQIAKENGLTNRYPRSHVSTYELDFTQKDKEIIGGVILLVDELKGLAFLSKAGEYKNLSINLKKAKGLARYYIIDKLRASKAAIVEHIKGTEKAKQDMQGEVIININSDNKGVISSISSMKADRNLHRSASYEHKDFFSDQGMEALKKKETSIYESIYKLVSHLSDMHVASRIDKIIELSNENVDKKLLVFDKSIITVKLIEAILKKRLSGNSSTIVYSLIGENNSESHRNSIKAALGINGVATSTSIHKNRRVIVVASNVLAESVNLQAASSILYSDVPLTPGNAEQREGRISRMNSPFSDISIWWPIPPKELILNTDRTIAKRYKTVQDALGSNINIPSFYEDFIDEDIGDDISVDDVIEHIADAGVSKGANDKAISMQDSLFYSRQYFKGFSEYYDNTKETKAKQNISFVRTKEPWGLFFLSNDGFGVPDLVLIKGVDLEVERRPEIIYQFLGKQLVNDNIFSIDDISDEDATRWLSYLSEMSNTVLDNNEVKKTKKEDALSRLVKSCLERWAKSEADTNGFLEIIERYKDMFGDRRFIRSWSKLIGAARKKAASEVLENLKGKGRARSYEFLTYNVHVKRELIGNSPLLPERLNEVFSRHKKEKMADTEIKAIILSIPDR